MFLRQKYVGRVLEVRRQQQRLTTFELADKVGVTQQTIAMYEIHGPSKFQIFLDICQALNVKPSTVFKHAEDIQKDEPTDV